MMKSKIKLNRYTIATAAVWAVSAILLGGGYALLYLPQQVKLLQAETQCSDSQMELERTQFVTRDQAKAKQIQQSQEFRQLISGFSIPENSVTELVFDIGRIANELNLSEFSSQDQREKNASAIEKSKDVSEVLLKVEFQATFRQFAQFLNQLECHDPVVFVEEVEFRRGQQDANKHTISLQLSFLAEMNTKKNKVASAAD